MSFKYTQPGFMLITLLALTTIISLIIGIMGYSHNFLYATLQQYKVQEQRYRAVETLVFYAALLCKESDFSSDQYIEKVSWFGICQKGVITIKIVSSECYTVTASIYEQNKVTYAVNAVLKKSDGSIKISSWQYASDLIA